MSRSLPEVVKPNSPMSRRYLNVCLLNHSLLKSPPTFSASHYARPRNKATAHLVLDRLSSSKMIKSQQRKVLRMKMTAARAHSAGNLPQSRLLAAEDPFKYNKLNNNYLQLRNSKTEAQSMMTIKSRALPFMRKYLTMESL